MSRLQVNCHAHVFNFASIFTPRTLEVLLDYLRLNPQGADLLPHLTSHLRRLVERVPDHGTPRDIFQEMLGGLSLTPHAGRLLAALGGEAGMGLSIVNPGVLDGLLRQALAGFLAGLLDWAMGQDQWREDAEEADLRDFLYFLYIGFLPTISRVTDVLMQGKEPDQGVVALMMDITSEAYQAEDGALFQDQIQQTSRQVLAYPGRFFPFVAVHPQRANHLALMTQALTQQGCVGVKLYPSLGYAVDQPALRTALRVCAELEAPVMVHCNRTGFVAAGQSHQAAPHLWRPILEAIPDLKVCFAHCGGDENLMADTPQAGGYTGELLALMRDFAGVYGDIAYHEGPMDGGAPEQRYMDRLRSWLGDPVIGRRILFGTDFHLVRRRLREASFWRYYQHHLGPDFDRIAVENPARYLGLPGPGSALGRSLAAQVDFVARHRDECRRAPAAWLAEELRSRHGISIVPLGAPGWSRDSLPALRTYLYIRDGQMYDSQRASHPFDQAGDLEVAELRYWNQGFEDPGISGGKAVYTADRMHEYLLANGCSPKSALGQGGAVAALAGAFNRADTRLRDLAAVVEKSYVCTWDQ